MISIIHLGSTSSLPKSVMRFKCGVCLCEFEASENDLHYDENIGWFTARCPCCYRDAHAWNEE